MGRRFDSFSFGLHFADLDITDKTACGEPCEQLNTWNTDLNSAEHTEINLCSFIKL